MTFRGITDNSKVDDRIVEYARKILNERDGTQKESLVLLDMDTGRLITEFHGSISDSRISYNDQLESVIRNAHDEGRRIISIHNHPGSNPPSAEDMVSAFSRGYSLGIVCGHDGSVYVYEPSARKWSQAEMDNLHSAISMQIMYMSTKEEQDALWIQMMNEKGLKVRKEQPKS